MKKIDPVDVLGKKFYIFLCWGIVWHSELINIISGDFSPEQPDRRFPSRSQMRWIGGCVVVLTKISKPAALGQPCGRGGVGNGPQGDEIERDPVRGGVTLSKSNTVYIVD